ncbi:MAG: class I SAM-dependent methyltransferase [Sphingomonas sp.]|nr:class I SAM-dependent methyltransferase [Sphingomonas sp.]
MNREAHTPPLGVAALTPLYDRAIAGLTREKVWRTMLVGHLDPRPGQRILDVGSGTGSLALAVSAAEPACRFHGIDPDEAAVAIARRKAATAGSTATFEVGRFDERPAAPDELADKIVCSLVLHQAPLAEKRRLLGAMFDRLKPGGALFVADYGLQPTLALRAAFRLTVQLLDGRADTQPNADGVLPGLIDAAGFRHRRCLDAIDTVTGRIEIVRAVRPAARERTS